MQFPNAFTIDERYDRVHASDRRSRFGAYLRQRSFVESGQRVDDPALFAAIAFEIALPPVMSPPYVAAHRCVLDVYRHSDDDGRAAIAVDLATSLPTPASELLGWRWRGWNIDGPSGRFRAPHDNERPVALSRVTLRHPIDARKLPAPRYTAAGTPHVDTAKEAVQLLALQLNGVLGELLAALAPRRAA